MNDATQFFDSGGGGYQIERSLRFNPPDSAYLSRTPGSAGNRKTWTWAGWVKKSSLAGTQNLFSNMNAGNSTGIYTNFATNLSVQDYASGTIWGLTSVPLYRDTSAWYHIVVAVDTTVATETDRVKLFVNGERIAVTGTYPGQDTDTRWNTTATVTLGTQGLVLLNYFSGYLADVYGIDGQALDPTSFGEFDDNGVWQPIAYQGTYGTNGFHLDFSDNSTAAALGTDTSGNGNTWTVNNISVAAGAGNDSLVDSPTNGTQTDTGAGGEVVGNYATFNPLASTATGTVVYSDGNLQATDSSAAGCRVGTIAVASGKFYWEIVLSAGTTDSAVGVMKATNSANVTPYGAPNVGYGASSGAKYVYASGSSYGASWGVNDVIGVALDMDAATVTFYKNGVSQGAISIDASVPHYPYCGDDSNATNSTWVANFGQRPFAYTAPSGFKALCTANLPTPTIADGSTAMDVALYTGNGSTQTISGLGFSPDLVWIKCRSHVGEHNLFDTVRGATKFVYSNLTNAEYTDATSLTAFNSDGFDLGVGTNSDTNITSRTQVAWCWDAGSSTVTNNDGTITSQVRANPSAGFSIVTYTGTGVTATVGHGLGVAPDLILCKIYSESGDWVVYHRNAGTTGHLVLNGIAAYTSSTMWSPVPDATTVKFDSSGYFGNNSGGKNYLLYCFAPVAGYSAFGSYTGNGSADGPFQWCGFRPRWVLTKASSSIGIWNIHDTARSNSNPTSKLLWAPSASNEVDYAGGDFTIDCLSNGFKARAATSSLNSNGVTYVWAAFAENPFKTSRAR